MKQKDIKELFLYLFKLTKQFVIELFEPKVSFYASSMSWATIFFIIPMLVIVLSIIIYTPMFSQYYDKIHNLITSTLVPTSSKLIISWIDSFVANAYQMGYVGIGYVIVASIMFFRDFDYIVNDIFDDNRRTFLKAIMVYGFLMVFVPISISLSIWLLTKIDHRLHFGPSILQFLIIWVTIFIVYKIAPKEKIKFRVLAISSFITTAIWYIAKSIFIYYILYNKTYTTIYGAVSVVLFTFLWIYISWTIFLHGLQLCSVLDKEEVKDKNEKIN